MIRGRCAMAVALVFAVMQSLDVRADELMHRIVKVGFVGPASSSTTPRTLLTFQTRLRELGYVEGQNLKMELRWAEGHYERLPALMDEVIEHNIDVLVTYSTPAAIAAKNATTRIPIVAAVMGDPVGAGLVASLAHPGGNITGLSAGYDERIMGKLLELLKEAVPRLSTVAVIRNPDNVATRRQTEALRVSAPQVGVKIIVIDVREPKDFERAFGEAARRSNSVSNSIAHQ